MTDGKKLAMSPFSPHLVDEETQKTISTSFRGVLEVTKEVPIECTYNFSFGKKADSELTQSDWKP